MQVPADVPVSSRFKNLRCKTALNRSIDPKGKSNAVTNPKSATAGGSIPAIDDARGEGAPLSATERSRLMRERRKLGLVVATVEIFRSEINWLVAAGLLSESERDNPSVIGYAIERLLERSARCNDVAAIQSKNHCQKI
jgi:hypothetical protein